MTQGASARQLGVTEAMVETFGPTIFRLSNNRQIRRGDPIRRKDFAAIEAQRAELGMADAEIAARIGLAPAQVTLIRNLEERRRFRRRRFQRLNQLGGGRRYRIERFRPADEAEPLGEAALRLRGAMRYRAEDVEAFVASGQWNGDTLTSLMNHHAESQPDAVAVESGARNERWGWAELAEHVERTARGLHALGIRRGEVVAVQLPNDLEYLASYLAICRIGAVMTTLYMSHREAELRHILGFSRARAIIVGPDQSDFSPAATALALRATLPELEQVIVTGDAPPAGARSWRALLDGGAAALPPEAAPLAADPFLLLFTSGTTAEPKAVPLSYQNMLSNARLSLPEHGLGGDDRILSVAPYGHLFGLYSFHLALHAGATTLVLPQFSAAALAALIEERQPTAIFAAPAHLLALLGATGAPAPMRGVRRIVLSGSAVPPHLVARLRERLPDGHVAQLWGMTETQAGLFTRPHDAVEIVAHSAGRPSPGAEVRIVDPAGAPLAAGNEGELQVRGCMLFPGYLDNPVANDAAFTEDGWFRTGDLAVSDPEGNVRITGRLKDVINRGGVKYNPREVEELLEAHPRVAEAAIVAMPDELLGERACCVVVPNGEPPSLQMLIEHLTGAGIARVKLPEKLLLVDEMPRTATGKVMKGALQQRALAYPDDSAYSDSATAHNVSDQHHAE